MTKAEGRVLEQDLDTETNIAMRRISWRTDHCPVLQLDSMTFMEFFPEVPAAELFKDAFVTHSPELDSLAAPTLDGIMEWQSRGNFHSRQPRPERAAQG